MFVGDGPNFRNGRCSQLAGPSKLIGFTNTPADDGLASWHLSRSTGTALSGLVEAVDIFCL